MQAGELTVSLNGRDVTSSFHADGAGLTGLVTGLKNGENLLKAEGRGRWGGHAGAELTITNYPISGPITSGPHITPFICQNQSFKLPDGTTLPAPLDADCSSPAVIQYVYLPAGGTAFKPLASTTSLPADVGTTTTLNGVKMPFVVRVETSVVNRGIYQSAVLHDPTSEKAPTPFGPPKGWNHRVAAFHGFGCPGGWYINGAAEGNLAPYGQLLDPTRLGEGYATYSNTLQHPSNNCNAVLQFETAVMSREHFIETFGVPKMTLSSGCSGGSYSSEQIADALPGFFDGILIACTFPDPLAIAFSAQDGHLLSHYFAATNPTGFTQAQQVAVSGYKGYQAWIDAANQAQRTDPVPGRVDIAGYGSAVWSAAVPASLRYDPVKNPTGARPTVFDWARNVYGVEPGTGFALRPFDNVGVQYGLGALNAGMISVAQFLDLNAKVGGYDHDANYVPNRVSGDLGAIRRAYESGLQLSGGGGLASIPVFDISGIMNDDGGYHYQWHHFEARERMRRANGNSDNHVMWRGNPVDFEKAWQLLVTWVEAVQADKGPGSQRDKVIRDKPAAAVDGCFASPTQFIAEPQVFGSAPTTQCNALFPSFAFPRYVAGGPVSADVLKCRLKPLDRADYKASFSDAQWAALQQTFPQGVCDFSKTSVAHRPVRIWGSFGPSPVNLVYDITGKLRPDGDDR